jgi:hypothetical protein
VDAESTDGIVVIIMTRRRNEFLMKCFFIDLLYTSSTKALPELLLRRMCALTKIRQMNTEPAQMVPVSG